MFEDLQGLVQQVKDASSSKQETIVRLERELRASKVSTSLQPRR